MVDGTPKQHTPGAGGQGPQSSDALCLRNGKQGLGRSYDGCHVVNEFINFR